MLVPTNTGNDRVVIAFAVPATTAAIIASAPPLAGRRCPPGRHPRTANRHRGPNVGRLAVQYAASRSLGTVPIGAGDNSRLVGHESGLCTHRCVPRSVVGYPAVTPVVSEAGAVSGGGCRELERITVDGRTTLRSDGLGAVGIGTLGPDRIEHSVAQYLERVEIDVTGELRGRVGPLGRVREPG